MTTHVALVLDSSGSMKSIKEDTIGGFNSFLEEQRGEEGKATITLIDFNSTVQSVYEGRHIEEASKLDEETYTPSGRTALYDAIATGINSVAAQTAENSDEDTVVVVVLTDGKENASETSQEVIREQIETRQEADGWEFLFIGANQDAALTAEGMGIDPNKSLNMADTGEGTREAYASTSRQLSDARAPEAEMDGFTEEDRQRQRDANPSS